MTRKWEPSIDDMADMLFDYYYGHGCDPLTERYGRRYGVSESTLLRRVREKTLLIYSTVDDLFRNSKLGKIEMRFDKTWQMDEKVIPVIDDVWKSAGNIVHSYKNKGSRRVAQIMICNIIAVPRTSFKLVSENVGKGTTEEIAMALLKTKMRVGSWPDELQVDPYSSHLMAHREYFSKKFKLKVLPKVGDYSQVKHAEGHHNAFERKMGSGLHGVDLHLARGHWLQSNFVEPKDDYGMTSFELASGVQQLPGSNKWRFLLELAYRNQAEKHLATNIHKPELHQSLIDNFTCDLQTKLLSPVVRNSAFL